MPAHTMNPASAEALISQLYTAPSPNQVVPKANNPKPEVVSSARMGMPRLLSLRRNLGALPSMASDHNIRVEAYKPELPADRIAVRITAFMIEEAKATPAFSSTRVKGEIAMSSMSAASRFGCV